MGCCGVAATATRAAAKKARQLATSAFAFIRWSSASVLPVVAGLGWNALGVRRTHVYSAHQAGFGVIEDVAMKHPGPGHALSIVEAHDQPHRALEGNIDGVLPGERFHRRAVLVEHLKEESVQMERVRPLR